MLPGTLILCWLLGMASSPATDSLHNDRYTLEVVRRGEIIVRAAGAPAQRLTPEFTVLWSDTDPQCARNAAHPNYVVAPRVAVRWRHADEPLEGLNAWLGSADFKAATGLTGIVYAGATGRWWEFRDGTGHVALRITGKPALDTTRPFSVGHRVVMRPRRIVADAGRLRVEYPPQDALALAAEITLSAADADPLVRFTLTPRREAFFSVAFSGAPDVPLANAVAVPQECAARGHKQFNFVLSEADLHLPRAQVATADFNVALAADPGECRFRLPTLANSRFGLMLAQENGRLKPVLLAPLLGGAESRMRVGEAWQFRFHVIAARLRWRQGQGPWQSQIDEIYPYEFSPELRDDGGDFACVLEVEDPQQKLSRSPVIVLPMSGRAGGPMSPPADAGPIVLPPPQPVVDKERAAAALSADFLGYLEHAANGTGLGLRDDGRYYPYSTPQGRRIAWRQPVWDLGLFAHGSTRDEAEQHLRAELGHALDALKESLAARQPPVDFTRLDRRQQETLLDFAHSEGAAGLHPEFVAAVLAGDWPRVMNQHLYVRYAGHAPDHPRNKAYADRWSPAGVSAP